MAFIVKKHTPFKKKFDIPNGNGAWIELVERKTSEADIASEALITKASFGGDIVVDIKEMYIAHISAWGGLEDEKGKEFKCTSVNKRLLLEQNTIDDDGEPVTALSLMRRWLQELHEEAAKEREAAEKN